MRKNPYYIVSALEDEFYLVPFGQAIEDHARTMRISEVAAFIWDEMDIHQNADALVGRLLEEYNILSEEKDLVENDIRELIKNLLRKGVLVDETEDEVGAMKESFGVNQYIKYPDYNASEDLIKLDEKGVSLHTVRIADITIRFFGEKKYFSDNFVPFCVDVENCEIDKENVDKGVKGKDISIFVTEKTPPKIEHMSLVLRGMFVELYEDGSFYAIRAIEIPEMQREFLCKDGRKAIIHMYSNTKLPEYARLLRYNRLKKAGMAKEWDNPEEVQVDFADCVFHAIRPAFLLRAQIFGMYAIHSASILHDGRAWLFSALSGTGKTTHTNIWHKLYGTPYLNGDLNLLAFEDGKPVVKGVPWCGTSGIFTTETYPLGGIILLSRDQRNHVEELSLQEQVLGIHMRFVSPKWNAKQTSESIAFAERIARSARIARLYCNMEDEAAEVCRAWIDNGKSEIF